MQDQNLEGALAQLQAERTRLIRRLDFCVDPDTRAALERQLRKIRADLDQFDALVRLARPRVQALRERNLRRLGFSTVGTR